MTRSQRRSGGAAASLEQAGGAVIDASLVDALAKEDELQTRAGDTADHHAAVRSFLAKTPPEFSGR